ncbi:uncharacterized protein ATNIH1004_005611 [Aspergillus tanneri]|uniref:Uncharacterized protein n=1 Tax=Aspergillus tanneri TaxID=1220188 RepID=A0A5M9MIU4_9EURO|nr:uncharacterized protein ATNIH1004_005611 [Aspergillus tanneri]KAA8646932.1 hypothetical protein ATNIH1004_005611 [Aspergillus tanneri]
MARQAFNIEIDDFHQFLVALLGKGAGHPRGPMSCLKEEEFYSPVLQIYWSGGHDLSRAQWHSVKTQSLNTVQLRATSTKTLVFPDKIPELKPTCQYIEFSNCMRAPRPPWPDVLFGDRASMTPNGGVALC